MRRFFLLFLLIIPRLVFAYGVIIPDTKEPGKVLPLALESYEIQVNIENQVARTKIKQVFINNFDYEIQGTYVFPLPPDATIHEFAMIINGEKIVGKVLEKEEAKNAYEELVRKTLNPALLEFMGKDMFQAKIAAIPAKGKQEIQLEYSQILKIDDGKVRYFYPLNTEKFNPLPLNIISLNIDLKTKQEIKNIYSPSHNISTFRIDEYTAKIGYEETHVVSRKDFVLFYTLSEKDFGLNLLTYRDASEDGYFLLMLAPPLENKGEVVAKDVAFVIDNSGSMGSGNKLNQAREALRFCIQALGVNDRFFLISYNSFYTDYKNEPLYATNENVSDAVKYIDKLNATGGTNINDTLIHTLDLIPNDKRPFYVLFLTDGIADININLIKGKNNDRARFFVFGVGNDVNKTALTQLAEANRGSITFVKQGEDIDMKISGLFAQINKPMLVNLSFDWGRKEVYDIFPKALPDLYQNSQLILIGRYTKPDKATISLEGETNQKKQKFTYEVNFTENDKTDDFIPRLWAKQKVDYLLEIIKKNGETKELKDEVVKLSKKYGFINQYTSFIVTPPPAKPQYTQQVQRDKVEGPVALKSHASPSYDMAEEDPMAVSFGIRAESNQIPSDIREDMNKLKWKKNKLDEITGQINIYQAKERVNAIRGSKENGDSFKKKTEEAKAKTDEIQKEYNELRKKLNEKLIAKYGKIPDWAATEAISSSESSLTSDKVKHIEDKTFYLKDNFWIDENYKEGDETIDIEFGSKEYFDLLAKEPELARYLSVGEQVIVRYKDKNYKIFKK